MKYIPYAYSESILSLDVYFRIRPNLNNQDELESLSKYCRKSNLNFLMLKKILIIFLTTILTLGVFAEEKKRQFPFKNAKILDDVEDCLNYFHKGKTIHKVNKSKGNFTFFVYDEELYSSIFAFDESGIQIICSKYELDD